jgi:Aldo/keto reductase family
MCHCAPSDSPYGKQSIHPITALRPTSTPPHTRRYGIRAFDTAPFYDNSEIVLGTALKALEQEFPRATYQLITKVGRYGPADFDYSPDTLSRSVRRSLQRLHTQYLDVVYLHDVEFIARCGVAPPRREGNHLSALGADAGEYGLASEEEQVKNVTGTHDGDDNDGDDGDERVLSAISALRTLQANGLIRHVGISGPFPSSSSNHCTTHISSHHQKIHRFPSPISPPNRSPRPKTYRPSPRHHPNLFSPDSPKLDSTRLRRGLSGPRARRPTDRRFAARHGFTRAASCTTIVASCA